MNSTKVETVDITKFINTELHRFQDWYSLRHYLFLDARMYYDRLGKFDEYNNDENPKLVIAATERVPEFVDDKWVFISVTHSGVLVQEKCMVCRFIQPKSSIEPLLHNIVNETFAKGELGLDYDVTADDIKNYSELLNSHGLTYGLTFAGEYEDSHDPSEGHTLTQALYSMDFSIDNLEILTNEKFDFDINQEIIDKYGLVIYVIGINSD